MPGKWTTRIVLLVGVLAIAGYLAGSAVAWTGSTGSPTTDAPDSPSALGDASLDGYTVVTRAPRSTTNGSIAVYDTTGTAVYRNATYGHYFDVDVVNGTQSTVEYAAAERVESSYCWTSSGTCWRQVIERLDLRTGETRRVYERVTRPTAAGLHDFERLGEDRLLIAGLTNDRVFVHNTTTGTVEWQWEARSHFDVDTGGSFPIDWTHLNDVERLDDGRVMVSMRNHDQVVFIEPGQGVVENWTLGSEGDHDVLYHQHNPDYVPADRGGPAVVVGDSENNRVVEYQRVDGEWRRSWTWRDVQMQWPRDADRLPNGNTLITDSDGNRVMEVDGEGEVVWQVSSDTPYEAERIGTGDESAGGQSARALGLANRTAGEGGGNANSSTASENSGGLVSFLDGAILGLKDFLPALLVNALLFVSPPWVGFTELLAVAALLGWLCLWVAAEFRWSSFSLRRPIARRG